MRCTNCVQHKVMVFGMIFQVFSLFVMEKGSHFFTFSVMAVKYIAVSENSSLASNEIMFQPNNVRY